MNKKLIVFTLGFGLILSGCQQPPKADLGITKTSTNPPTTMTTTPTPSVAKSDQLLPPVKGDSIASIETDKGIIKVKLFPQYTPETVKNFTELAKDGKFDNVPFHRIIKDFMIQTGDFDKKNGTGGYSYKGPGTKINNEVSENMLHHKGTVSMANAGPNTNGSQFFIVTADQGTPFLNGQYSAFGQVIEGQDIADAISKVPTGSMDKPVTPVTMKKVTVSTF